MFQKRKQLISINIFVLHYEGVASVIDNTKIFPQLYNILANLHPFAFALSLNIFRTVVFSSHFKLLVQLNLSSCLISYCLYKEITEARSFLFVLPMHIVPFSIARTYILLRLKMFCDVFHVLEIWLNCVLYIFIYKNIEFFLSILAPSPVFYGIKQVTDLVITASDCVESTNNITVTNHNVFCPLNE